MPRQLMQRPRRLPAPNSLGGRPILEQQHQFLYSACAIDNAAAIPAQLNFFGYAKGNTVSGAGNAVATVATLFHTNMDTPGALAQPKVFTVTGIRVFIPNIAFTVTANTPELVDPSFGAAAVDSDALEDLLLIQNSTVLRFFVGAKNYVNHPTFLAPANCGMAGVAALAQDNGTAATVGSLDASAPHMVGVYYDMPVYPVVIASQQAFGAQLLSFWSTNPTLNDDRLVYVFLDGLLGREVQ